MDGLGILIIYVLILTGHIINLIYRYKKGNGWGLTLTGQALSIIIAITIGKHYDGKEGYGEMPGFTYLSEVLFSYAAAIAFAVVFIVTIFLYVKNRNR